jgi:hypothetical protein
VTTPVLSLPPHPAFDALERSHVLAITAETLPDELATTLTALRGELSGADPLTDAVVREYVSRHLRGLGYLNPAALLAAALGHAPIAGALEPTLAGPLVMTAAELLTRRDLMQPPRTIVPRFAFSSCLTLLSALPKAGKSTLLSALTSAVSRGRPFLEGLCPAGDVLWWSSDMESHFRVVSRLADFDADLARVKIVLTRPRDFAAFLALVREHRPALAIVDTLAPAAGVVHAGAPDEWLAPLTDLRDTCRTTEAAVLLSHHSPRSAPNRARDSNAIEAACDVVIGMSEEPGQPSRRTFDVRARWASENFALRLEGTHFQTDAGLPSLEVRILGVIVAHPGLSGSAIAGKIEARKTDVLAELKRMATVRVLEDRPDTRSSHYYALTPSAEAPVPAVPEPVGTAPGGTGSRFYREPEPVPVPGELRTDPEPVTGTNWCPAMPTTPSR